MTTLLAGNIFRKRSKEIITVENKVKNRESLFCEIFERLMRRNC